MFLFFTLRVSAQTRETSSCSRLCGSTSLKSDWARSRWMQVMLWCGCQVLPSALFRERRSSENQQWQIITAPSFSPKAKTFLFNYAFSASRTSAFSLFAESHYSTCAARKGFMFGFLDNDLVLCCSESTMWRYYPRVLYSIS